MTPSREETVAGEALRVLEHARCLYSGEEVRRAIEKLAADIQPVLADKNPIMLAVMQGGVYTAVQLSRRLEFPHEFDYVHATRYGEKLVGGELRWKVRPTERLRGRVVLVVDDVLDKGTTLAALHGELGRLGVAAIYTAVLVVKNVPRDAKPRIDFAGLSVDDIYIFGSGLDYKGYWRGLQGLYGVAE